jgi:hypothetical protein
LAAKLQNYMGMKPRALLARIAITAALLSPIAGCAPEIMDEDAIPDGVDVDDAELGLKPQDFARVLQAAANAGLGCNSKAVIATAVARAESTFQERIVNGREPGETCHWSAGLWQINCVHGYGQEWLKDIDNNARAMARVSSNGTNFRPWTMYTNGVYRRYLSAAWSAKETYGCDGAGPNVGADVGLSPSLTPAPSGSCQSQTLGCTRDVKQCVQSRATNLWYQCTQYGWVKLSSNPTATSTGVGMLGDCSFSYPLGAPNPCQ